MPHITIKNLDKKNVMNLCNKLTVKLAKVINCPVEAITFNHTPNTTYTYINYDNLEEGVEAKKNIILVHLKWFKRDDKVQDEVAKILLDEIKNELPKENVDVVINFEGMEKGTYYRKGVKR